MSDAGLFEHLAVTDDSERVSARQAAAVASKRVKDLLGEFVSRSASAEEREARLALVKEDVEQVVSSVVDEYGGDYDKVLATVRESLSPPLGEGVGPSDPTGPRFHPSDLGVEGVDPNSVQDCPNCGGPGFESACEHCGYDPAAESERRYFDLADPAYQNDLRGHNYSEEPQNDAYDEYYSSVRESRRPKMCPYHSELVDSSLQVGEPQYAAFSGLVGGPSHCKGGFEGSCNFKPEMVTSEFWDTRKQEADERAKQRELERAQPEPIVPVPEAGEPIPGDEGSGITDLDHELSDAPSAVGDGPSEDAPSLAPAEPAMAMASVRTSEAPRDGGGAVRQDDLPTRTNDRTTPPSPETDHTQWKPNALNPDGNLPARPEGEEMDGSPHPSEFTDVKDDPDYKGDDFKEQTEAVTEHQDLPAAEGDAVSTERNISQEGQSDTWSGLSGQATPVTQEVFSAAQDPSHNPIRRILESGFATASEVESAIQQHKSNSEKE
jgi:hypothetical protein